MNANKNKVVIGTVAKTAGCSTATVSRVLSNSSYPVKEATRERVLLAANQLGYSPNPYGRILRTATNPFIGIVIPSFQNPFFSQIVMGVEKIASKRGYLTMVLCSQRNPELERKYIYTMEQKRVSCLMLCSIDDNSSALEKYLNSGGLACVFESSFPQLSNTLNACADMFRAAQIATEYLISQGHRRIAFLTSPLSRSVRNQRVDGCRFVMSLHGIPFDNSDIISATYETEDDEDDSMYEFSIGVKLAKQTLASPKKYTAVIALNDQIACGVIAGFHQNGIRVPENISIISFDDIPNATIVTPQLTTVRLFGHVIGQRATQMIIDAYESKESSSHVTLSVMPELVVRESVAKIQPD